MGSVRVGEYQRLSQAAGGRIPDWEAGSRYESRWRFQTPDWLRSAVRQTPFFWSVTYQPVAGALTPSPPVTEKRSVIR